MNKDQEKKLVDLKVRMALKQRALEDANPDEMDTTELDKITAEIEEIKKDIEAVESEIAETKKEEDAINEENEDLKKEEERKKMANQEVKAVRIETAEERTAKVKEIEERAKALKEGRSITVASSNILLPKHQSDDLATYPFQPVSSLIDAVNVVNLDGGETYEKAFVKEYGTGGLTSEGADYTTAEPTFGYATISKAKITAYAELSEEVLKLPAVNYEAEVTKGVEIALKKKMSQQIIAGAGTTNTFKGITASGVEALEADDKVEASAITSTTLDEILFSFGGDEEVMGGGVLILNKLDLKAFATLRDEVNGLKIHNVDYKAKTIDGIPYIINSNLPALSDSNTATGTTCMLFGTPKGYDMTIFSPVEVMKSTDYKFKQGIVCYKASVFAGGNVGAYRSFIKVNKK
jgi:HK97 family phage major capsid protein